MLRTISKTKARARGGRFAIVASKYNARYVDAMIRAAEAELHLNQAAEVRVLRVPGAFEIPVVAAELAGSTPPWDAVICLGVVLRGATTHAQHIGEAVSAALMNLQVKHRVPMIHEVLLLENRRQAEERCLDPRHNRGHEAAQTALAIAKVLAGLRR
jgi:6,7-dimethyl-8-ribityllumazine synthase